MTAATGGVSAVAVGSHVARGNKAWPAFGDELQEPAGDETGQNLRADVCWSVLPLETFGDGQANGDGGVEMAA